MSFFTAPAFAVTGTPIAQAVGDFNGDGHADMVVANRTANTVSVLMGTGDGTFQPRTDYATGTTPVSLAAGDFNGDGKLDLAVAAENTSNDSVSILRGNGDGTFQAPVNLITDSAPRAFPVLQFPSTVAVGDLNGDGHPDLVVVNNKDTPAFGRTLPQDPPGTVSVLLNNGDGTFKAPVNYAVLNSPGPVVIGDFNGDAHPDFAVANRTGTVSVFLGAGAGNFGTRTDYAAGFDPVSLVEADFNGDGHLDLAVSSPANSSLTDVVAVLTGQGDGTFQSTAMYLAPRSSWSLTAGDVNGDGHPDLLTGSVAANNVSVWLNNGTGGYPAPPLVANPGVTLGTQATADFNGDGIADQATIASNLVSVKLGLGDGQFGDQSTYSGGLAPDSVAAADLNADGIPDLVVGSTQTFAGKVALMVNSPGWDNRTAGAVGLAISAPQQVTAGSTFSVTITAVDALGNPVPGFHGTVDLDVRQAGAASPAIMQYDFTAADAGRHTFVGTQLTTAGSGTVSAFAAALPSVSAAVTVVPAATAQYVFSTPASVPAGTAFGFSITAEDVYGNVETGYTGTVHFAASTSDTQAVLPADYTFTAADAGIHAFSATLFKTRTATTAPFIAATDTLTGTSSTAYVNVTALAPVSLSVTPIPSSVVAGSPQGLFVSALDVYGNVATSYAGTVHFSSSDPHAILPADYTFTAADQGSRLFIITLTTAGTQSLTVADTATASFTQTQPGIVVSAAAASVWSFRGLPAATTAGVTQSFTLTAMDAYGNVVTGYSGRVHFTSSDSQATLPADYTYTTADAGSHTFSVTWRTSGTQSLTVTDTVNTAFTGTQSGITVNAAAAASITVAGFPATTAGVAHTFTVTARDAFGNVATGYTGTVSFTSTDPLAALPASYTFTAADAGIHTFSATLKKAGTQSITAQDTATPALASAETGIAVSAAAVSHFAITGPSSVTQGVGFNITVSAVDDFGNVNAGYRGKVHFTTTATNAGLPSDFTYSNNDNGVHVFSVTLNTLGFQTVTVTDMSNSSIKGSIIVDVLPKP